MPPPREDRYVESTVRLNAVTGVGAVCISLLTVAVTWGDWRSVAVVCITQTVLVAFNMWANLVLLKRRGTIFTESLRTAVNVTGFIVVAQLTHFPLPVWLWLPFVALTFDQFSRRAATSILLAICATADALACLDHVPWRYPITFTMLGFLSLEFSRAKLHVIRHMLANSEAQRRDLEAAHAEILEARERLTAEAKARQEMEIELRQAQKMEEMGRLAAGIAHEINTPVQFVGDGVHFLKEATADLLALVHAHQEIMQTAFAGGSPSDAATAAADAEAEADLEFLSANLPDAVARTLDGVERIATIVRSMKEFAHPDRKEATESDLNRALEATIVIARHEYKLVADLETDFEELPRVCCHGGQVNQVFLNVLVNAAHAVGDAVKGTDSKGRIAVRTRRDDDHVVVAISDTGRGIPTEIRERIFEPFFTTKEVGKGTGQGLALARKVVHAHGGTLRFESELGRGTTFFIRLPIVRKGSQKELVA